MIVGAQLYTARDLCKDENGLKETLGKLSAAGYTAVQISGIGPIPVQKIREICDDNGMKIVVTHTHPDRILKDTDAVAEEHKILGCDYVGVGALPMQYERNRDGIRRFVNDFSEAASKLAKYGLTFHYHNHSFEFEKDEEGVRWFDRMIDESDPKLFYFILDTYWVQHGGACPVGYIKRLNGRIKAIHFKDMAIRSNKQCFASIGSGNLNWDRIISACNDTNVPYAMIEQDSDFVDDPVSELIRSYKFLAGKGLH